MSNTEVRTFQENLKRWRAREGLTLRQAGARLGVSHAQIVKFEQGKANPRLKDLVHIAGVLGVPLESLLREVTFEEHQA